MSAIRFKEDNDFARSFKIAVFDCFVQEALRSELKESEAMSDHFEDIAALFLEACRTQTIPENMQKWTPPFFFKNDMSACV